GSHQIPNVFSQVCFADSHPGRAYDEAARRYVFVAAKLLDQLPQALAFSIRLNFSRHADMFNCGHVNEEPAWQGDVRSDPRTFFGDWLLGNLDQNFLPFTKQVG